MSSNRNRNAGYSWERLCAKNLREVGFTDVKTSRECSRLRDSQKVDLCNADESANGRLPFNIQCKTLSSTAPYPKLLKELEEFNGTGRINVVFHRMTQKTPAGRFVSVGEYALLKLNDFYSLMEDYLKLRENG